MGDVEESDPPPSRTLSPSTVLITVYTDGQTDEAIDVFQVVPTLHLMFQTPFYHS